jgi:hypothetical protein
MSEDPKVAAALAAAAAARAISAEAAAAAARAHADAAAAAVEAAEADVAATEAAVRHRAKRMRALDWEAIVGIYDGDGNGALDPGEFVEVVYDALRMTGIPETRDGAFRIAATLASSSAWGSDGTMARVDASTLRKAAAAGVFSCIEPPRPSPFAFQTSGDSSLAHFAAFMSAALRERILCEPNSVTYSLPRSERTAGPGPSWGEGGVAVPLEPPVRSGVHEIVFNVRSDPRKFVVSVMSPLNLRSRNRVSQLTPSLGCSPAPFI